MQVVKAMSKLSENPYTKWKAWAHKMYPIFE